MTIVAKKMLEENFMYNDTRQLSESINIMMEIQSDKHPSRLERSKKQEEAISGYRIHFLNIYTHANAITSMHKRI